MNKFEKRQAEKMLNERVQDYYNPAHQEGMIKLFELVRKGEIKVPECGRKRF